MVVEGDSCVKDLRVVGRVFQRWGEELWKEWSENLSLEVRGDGSERESGVKGRRVSEGKVMVVEVGSCDKDLKLIGREFQRLGEKLQKERSENLSLQVRGGRERQGSYKSKFYQCIWDWWDYADYTDMMVQIYGGDCEL